MKNSPKFLILLAGLALLAAPAVRAEDPATPSDKPEHKRGPGAMMERAAKELNLTDDQQAKWKAIGADEKAALDALKADTTVAKEDKRAKMMEITKNFADQRRAVLTDDQAKKFDEMRAKMRERGPRGPKGDNGDKPEKKD